MAEENKTGAVDIVKGLVITILMGVLFLNGRAWLDWSTWTETRDGLNAANLVMKKSTQMHANEIVKIPGSANPAAVRSKLMPEARTINDFRKLGNEIRATAEGRVVAEVTAITPTHLWTDTQKEVYTKTRVTVSGQMMGSAAAGSALNKWSGPMGWVDSDVPDWLDKSRRLCPQFPYLAVVGRIETSDMNPYSCEGVFLVGNGTDITPGSAGGKLKLGLNEIVRSQFGGVITTHLTDNGGGFTYEIRPH